MKTMLRLLLLSVLLAAPALGAAPNVLVIPADDAGYADFGFQGGGISGDLAALTPNRY
jgi:arylsulfatase A-like enzyme